ncbi:MAG: recombinase family protein, partial [Rikenellaceae bacterium]|nr:recombinase family protein [Rikenellaceae bacterium]
MKLGYARCSTLDQNLDWQIDALTKEGCDRIFQEKFTGTRKDRPELLRMMDMLREGDTVIICELTRLSRSVKDLFDLVEQVEKAGAHIKSLKEPWLDPTTPQGRLLFTNFSGVSQFERELIRERTMEGLASARARGRMGGRPSKDPKIVEQALTL